MLTDQELKIEYEHYLQRIQKTGAVAVCYEFWLEDRRVQESLGTDWIAYSDLQRMTIVSLIDHMLYCQKQAAICLEHTNPNMRHGKRQWAGYRNQVMWCLQVLQECGVYNADPYRDDKKYKYFKEK